MARSFRCLLPGRAGMTLRLGQQRLAVGPDGLVQVHDGDEGYFLEQPAVWLPVAGEGGWQGGSILGEVLSDAGSERADAPAGPVSPKRRRGR